MKNLAIVLFLIGSASAQFLSLPNAYPDSSTPGDSGLFLFQKNPYSLGKVKSIRASQLRAYIGRDTIVDTGSVDCDSIMVGNGLVKTGNSSHCTIAADSTRKMVLDTLRLKGPLTGTAASLATLTVASSVSSDNTVLLENTSSTGFGPYVKAGSTSRYALFIQDYTGVNPLLFLGGNAHLGIGISDPTENFGLKALSGNTSMRIWRGTGTDYGLGFTAEDGNGDVDIMSMGDASGVTMHFKMRGLGTPVDAFDIAGSGISTFNFRVNTLNTYYERGLEMATRGYVDSLPFGISLGYFDSTLSGLHPVTGMVNEYRILGTTPNGGGAPTISQLSHVWGGVTSAGADVIIDTIPGYAAGATIYMDNGSGGGSVQFPPPSGVPDGARYTIVACVNSIDSSVTLSNGDGYSFTPSGNPTVILPRNKVVVVSAVPINFEGVCSETYALDKRHSTWALVEEGTGDPY